MFFSITQPDIRALYNSNLNKYGGKIYITENATNIIDIKPQAFDRNREAVIPCVQYQRTVVSFFVFPHGKLDLRYRFSYVNRKLRSLILKNISTLCLKVGRFQEKPVFCFNVCSGDTH